MTIRRQPSDFCVDERLDQALEGAMRPEPSRATPHAVYRLSKTSLTTPEALTNLGRALGVPHALMGYGGLKDKHAQTSQHISVPTHNPRHAADLLQSVTDPQGRWSASLIGWTAAPLDSKSIAANHFTIIVRDLSRDAASAMQSRAELLTDGSSDGPLAVNYFGAQRFGSARHGQGWIAERLLAGDFEGALRLAIATPARKDSGKTRAFTRLAAQNWGDWKRLISELPRMPERRPIETLAQGGSFRQAFAQLPTFLQSLYVEAFQSYLWNRTAFGLLESATPSAKRIMTDDEFGTMLFVPGSCVGAELLALNLPMLAPGVSLVDPWAAAAQRVIAEHNLTAGDLRIPGLKRPFFGKAERPLFARAGGFTLSPRHPDELTPNRFKVVVAFDLPRGSYATVVLRALGQ